VANLYGPRIVTDGLLMCLDASNTDSYSGSGTAWNDLTQHANSGTLVNMDSSNYDSTSRGKFGFNFGATNEYVNTGFYYDGANQELTMGVWMRAPAVAQRCGLFGFRSAWNGSVVMSQNQLYICGDTSAGTVGTGCTFDDWRRNPDGTFPAWRSVYALSTPVCDGNWHFIMVSRSAAATRLYVDANLIDENTDGSITQITSDNNFKLGIAGNSAGVLSSYYFNGDIATSYIYSTGLTTAQIQQIYHSTKGRFGL